jgi:OmpA-OmpF porin, OOP family
LKGWSRAGRPIGACLLSVLTATPAFAQYDDEPLPTWYVGPFVGYTFADPDRGAKDGLNLQVLAGRVLYDAIAVEVNAFATQLDSELAGGPDTDLMGGGVDLALGVAAQGYPVFLLGAGFVQQDIGGESKTQTFGNLGMGLYLPFSVAGELWRLEGRYHVTTGEHPALAGEDLVDDLRVNLGVLFAFGGEEPAPPAESQPPPPAQTLPPPPVEPAPVEPAPAEPAPAEPAPVEEPKAAEEPTPAAAEAPVPVVAPPAPEPEPAAPVDTDADDDGIEDADDKCPGTAPDSKVDGKGCVVVEDVTIRSAYFGSSSSSLTAKAYELLRDVAAALQADPQVRLEIQGHSDTSGSAAQNVPLSQQRAEAVREFLINLGIAPERLVAKGYGAFRPVNDNATLEQRAANRRVTFARIGGTP